MNVEEYREIRQAFTVEAGELLAEMEEALLALEAVPGNESAFNRLFRSVHTVKGSAGIVGFEPLERFCHAMEHLLVRIREGTERLTAPLISLLLACHDHIGIMAAEFGGQDAGAAAAIPDGRHEALLLQLQDRHGLATIPGQEPPSPPDSAMMPDLSRNFGLFDDAFPHPSPAPAPPLPSGDAGRTEQRVVRVDAGKLDQLSDLIVELVTASSVLEAHVRRVADSACSESVQHVSTLVKQLQERSMVFRMVPAGAMFRRFQRIVRDLNDSSGKEIQLVVAGGECELDKAVAEKLHEPLLHLVRNAADHGIEAADERSRAGKPAAGTIRLDARHENGTVLITVGDDGRGIDLEAVERTAAERGLLKREGTPLRQELLDCIFAPGFSTARQATLLSGRGVGMDAVLQTVQSLRGTVTVETEAGAGTTFTIALPLSLALVDGFMVSLAGTLFIIPMECVQETLELPDTSRPGAMANGCLSLRNTLLPCLDLRTLLGVGGTPPAIRHVVVVRHATGRMGLITDQLHGEIKSVIKPLGRLYRNHGSVAGASILGDGTIALHLEVERMIDAARRTQPARQR